MLKINYEFRKGLLFIRLKGVLTKDTSVELSTSLDKLINENGVKYFVINIENLNYLDNNGLEILKNKYEDMIMHDGKLVICGYQNNLYNKDILSEMKGVIKSNSELSAFKLIRI